MAKAAAKALGLDVDAACRKLAELQQRLKSGTLEQAVDFHNDHGQRVKHGVANTVIYEEYLGHPHPFRTPAVCLHRKGHRRIQGANARTL